MFLRAHRKPETTFSSICALLTAMHHIYYEREDCDPLRLGNAMLSITELVLEKGMTDMNASKLEKANVLYHDLIKDPIGVVKDIYQQFGWEYSTEYDKILHEFLEEDAKKRDKLKTKYNVPKATTQGLHTYSTEEYGVNKEVFRKGTFDKYTKNFQL